MKTGKVEIAELAIIVIMFFAFLAAGIIISGKIDLEKEKTKQLETQLQIEQKKLEEKEASND